MKKLILSLFALTTISSFAAASNLDTATTNIKVTASIKAQTQLIISDSTTGTAVDTILIHHGGKDGIDKTSIQNDDLVTGVTAYLKRTGEDELLFHTRTGGMSAIQVSLPGTATLASEEVDTVLTASLDAKVGDLSSDSKSAPLVITSTLTKDQIMAAKAANDYTSGNVTLTVTIN